MEDISFILQIKYKITIGKVFLNHENFFVKKNKHHNLIYILD
jgi:hypothetical protein